MVLPEVLQETNWDAAMHAIGNLHVPSDVSDRVRDISSFKADDIMAAAIALHIELAPNVSHEVTDTHMSVVGRSEDSEKRLLVAPEKRHEIFNKVAELLAELAKNVKPGEEQAYLERAGNVIALGLVLAHPFEDGNGRTARTLGHIIREGQVDADDLKVIGKNRDYEGFRINSYVPTGEGSNMEPNGILAAAASLEVPLSDAEAYKIKTNQIYTTPYGH